MSSYPGNSLIIILESLCLFLVLGYLFPIAYVLLLIDLCPHFGGEDPLKIVSQKRILGNVFPDPLSVYNFTLFIV